MRVFVAGGTGATGRPLVAALRAGRPRADGHRPASRQRAAALRETASAPVVADAFDAEAVRAAIAAARPEVSCTSSPRSPDRLEPRRDARAAGADGTGCAARRSGRSPRRPATPARVRLVAQSVSFMLRPEGGWVKDETVPLWADAPDGLRDAVDALRVMRTRRSARTAWRASSWRYTGLPRRAGHQLRTRRSLRRGGPPPALPRGRRRLGPLPRSSDVDDAAAATVLALDRGGPGVYHVTDGRARPRPRVGARRGGDRAKPPAPRIPLAREDRPPARPPSAWSASGARRTPRHATSWASRPPSRPTVRGSPGFGTAAYLKEALWARRGAPPWTVAIATIATAAMALSACANGRTAPATDVGPTTATLHGSYSSDRDEDASWWFEYGTSTAYGTSTTTTR